MTKAQLLNWLQANKDYLNISAIGRAAGVKHLRNVLNENKDSRGRVAELADRHVEPLTRIVDGIKR